MKPSVRGVLAIWLVVVFLLGAAGAFVRHPGTPPIPILIGATVPLILFLAAYRGSAAFRAFILAIDLLLATAIQAWRAGGLGFLALYAHGVLPAVFAWPAGLGDIAIGVTAPWVALALVRRPNFANSRAFVVWNLLGILDLVVAVSVGALFSSCLWCCWRRDDRADGTLAARADPRVPRDLVHHVAFDRTLPGTTAPIYPTLT